MKRALGTITSVSACLTLAAMMLGGCGGSGNGYGGGSSAIAPTVNITVSPQSIPVGQSSTLSWSSTDATSCTASDGWSGGVGTSGSEAVSPGSAGSYTYTLYCSGAGGSVTESAALTVTNTPGVPRVGSCQIYPADNPFNTDISAAPVHPNSDKLIASMNIVSSANPGGAWRLHPNFTLPVEVVDSSQPAVTITQSTTWNCDAGSMPIPANAQIQGGPSATGDRHVIVVDQDACVDYELYRAFKDSSGPGWTAECSGVFDLKANDNHPYKKVTDTASGIPFYPGLVKYSEVQSGVMNHALVIVVTDTFLAAIRPAFNCAKASTTSTTDPNYPDFPPMGLRIRLKSSYDISALSHDTQVILQALKTYGAFIQDNSNVSGFIAGATDFPGAYNFGPLNTELGAVPVTAFEAVSTGTAVAGCP